MKIDALRKRRIRHTKVVCTIGPACLDEDVLREMIAAGLNAARLNFSHGDHAQHKKAVDLIRGLSVEFRRPIAIIADLQGPKISIGDIEGERMLETGSTLRVLTRNLPSAKDLGKDDLPVRLPSLPQWIEPGAQIMLADGTIRLKVVKVEIETGSLICSVEEGGRISSNKGVNLPGVELEIPSLTAKDLDDLAFALSLEVDYIAQSFVRSPDDIEQLRSHIVAGKPVNRPQIIAKIEKHIAVDRLDDIMAAADGVMVARGDLGVELGAEQVPLVQKEIIRKANELGIPVITATQMLETMTYNPEPTRAEASDVANAILDGTSAVMLSGETAMGRHPVEVIRVIDRIARTVEPAMAGPTQYLLAGRRTVSIPQALSDTACEIGELLDAAAIVVLTETGRTARQVVRNRPKRPVVAASKSVYTCRRLALDWGTIPVWMRDGISSNSGTFEQSTEAARRSRVVYHGERVIFTAGTISGRPGMTNMLKVEEFEPEVIV